MIRNKNEQKENYQLSPYKQGATGSNPVSPTKVNKTPQKMWGFLLYKISELAREVWGKNKTMSKANGFVYRLRVEMDAE